MANNVDADLDYVLALSLQEQFYEEAAVELQSIKEPDALVEEVEKRCDPRSIVDHFWELADPNPKIHDLYVEFDAMFFSCSLVRNGVEVKWSDRMTLCAGVCSYEGRGGLCSIRLSKPLLKLRPRRDLVETLLHEMIHAYLFVSENNRDHDGHGPQFLAHMHRINKLTGAKISVYHSFHNEVNQYKQHWWKCNGPCQHRRPFFGLVKRAMNRAPSPNDRWWGDHQKTCGGTFTKIKEPEGYKAKGGKNNGESSKSTKGKETATEKSKSGSIQTILSDTGQGGALGANRPRDNAVSPSTVKTFVGVGHVLSGSANHSLNNSTREKMLEAAEKRREMSQRRGISSEKRKRLLPPSSCSGDIRKFCSTSPSKGATYSSEVVEIPSAAPASKKPRVSRSPSSENDCVILKEEKDVVLDLTDDAGTVKTQASISEGGHWSPSREDEVTPNAISTGKDLRMCPVCGRVDIPPAIINFHVAFCLEEDSESRTID